MGEHHQILACEYLGQYHINRQESLTRDFSSEKGVKPQEYSVYFKVLQTHFWRKRVPGVPTKAQQSTRKGYAASVAQQSC